LRYTGVVDKPPHNERATAYIALGGNEGHVLGAFNRALRTLAENNVVVFAVSCAYRTRALLPPNTSESRPDYWNAAAGLRTNLSAWELLRLMLRIEDAAGRKRRERWADRPLDLDLLLYNQDVIVEPDLEVPHPQIRQRAFVLHPLADIASGVRVPPTGVRVGELLENLPDRYDGVEYVLRGWLDLDLPGRSSNDAWSS